MKRVLSFVLIFLMVISLFACANNKEGTETEGKLNTTATDADIAALKELYKGREAFHGNLHDHSDSGDPANDPWKTADGKYRIEMWPNFLLEKDLDFVALVDHRQSRHMRLDCWDETMFIGATETGHRRPDNNGTIDAMHYNILMTDVDAFENIMASFSKFNYSNGYFKIYSNNPLTEEEFSQMVGMVNASGGIVVHVHPCYGDEATGDSYMTSENPLDYYMGEYTGFEVLCGYQDKNMTGNDNMESYAMWVTLLNMGKHVYAFAGADTHRQTNTVSASTVYAEERLAASYMSHIVKGDFTAGPAGIRMVVGDTVMGGHTEFAGKRLVIGVGDFQSKEYRKDHVYRLDVYNEIGLVFSQEFDSSKEAYFAIDATDCKYYRADIYDVTSDYIFAVGNPIWNE